MAIRGHVSLLLNVWHINGDEGVWATGLHLTDALQCENSHLKTQGT